MKNKDKTGWEEVRYDNEDNNMKKQEKIEQMRKERQRQQRTNIYLQGNSERNIQDIMRKMK